jgi:hypothetical protein
MWPAASSGLTSAAAAGRTDRRTIADKAITACLKRVGRCSWLKHRPGADAPDHLAVTCRSRCAGRWYPVANPGHDRSDAISRTDDWLAELYSADVAALRGRRHAVTGVKDEIASRPAIGSIVRNGVVKMNGPTL